MAPQSLLKMQLIMHNFFNYLTSVQLQFVLSVYTIAILICPYIQTDLHLNARGVVLQPKESAILRKNCLVIDYPRHKDKIVQQIKGIYFHSPSVSSSKPKSKQLPFNPNSQPHNITSVFQSEYMRKKTLE